MESTAVYWIPVWRVLEPHFHLKLVNPYFIKQLPGRKSDVKDAQWIAEENRRDRFDSRPVGIKNLQSP
jgi:transposase